MMSLPTETKQWHLSATPRGLPTTTGPNATFKLVTAPLPTLKDGDLLLKTLYLSNDPAQRGWISPIAEPGRFYAPPVPLHSTMRAYAVCEVLASRSADTRFAPGKQVLANAGWAQYAVLPGRECQAAPPLPRGLGASHYLGALGSNGMTAYYGLVEVAETKPTDVVVVSGAAGATGSLVVKIARHVLGCRKVIGIAGGPKKCEYVKSIGADICVDYKSPTLRKDLWAATARKADVYFDNVGGKVLDLALSCLTHNARVAVCGSISGYNDEAPHALRNWHEVIAQRVTLRGFVVFDFWPRRAALLETLLRALAEGKLVIDEGAETVVPTAFEDVPRTWLRLFDGSSTGKLVTDLSGAQRASKI